MVGVASSLFPSQIILLVIRFNHLKISHYIVGMWCSISVCTVKVLFMCISNFAQISNDTSLLTSVLLQHMTRDSFHSSLCNLKVADCYWNFLLLSIDLLEAIMDSTDR